MLNFSHLARRFRLTLGGYFATKGARRCWSSRINLIAYAKYIMHVARKSQLSQTLWKAWVAQTTAEFADTWARQTNENLATFVPSKKRKVNESFSKHCSVSNVSNVFPLWKIFWIKCFATICKCASPLAAYLWQDPGSYLRGVFPNILGLQR